MGKKKEGSKVGKFLLGVFIGSAVGSILGVTFAPKSGRELRGQIAKNSKKTWREIREIVDSEKGKKGVWCYLNKKFIQKRSDEEKD